MSPRPSGVNAIWHAREDQWSHQAWLPEPVGFPCTSEGVLHCAGYRLGQWYLGRGQLGALWGSDAASGAAVLGAGDRADEDGVWTMSVAVRECVLTRQPMAPALPQARVLLSGWVPSEASSKCMTECHWRSPATLKHLAAPWGSSCESCKVAMCKNLRHTAPRVRHCCLWEAN